jgi:hypothetical protein
VCEGEELRTPGIRWLCGRAGRLHAAIRRYQLPAHSRKEEITFPCFRRSYYSVANPHSCAGTFNHCIAAHVSWWYNFLVEGKEKFTFPCFRRLILLRHRSALLCWDVNYSIAAHVNFLERCLLRIIFYSDTNPHSCVGALSVVRRTCNLWCICM